VAGGAAAPAAASAAETTAAHPIVVIMEENHGYWQTVNNAAMPYWNKLWTQGQDKTGPVLDLPYGYSVGHPSLPNYLALTSGSTQGKDEKGGDSVTFAEFNVPSLWDQLTAAGISWGVYGEDMPSVCSKAVTADGGLYVMRHVPGDDYAPVADSAECQNVRPLSDLNVADLPAVTWITPNLCDDFHGTPGTASACPVASTGLVRQSDAWLSTWVPQLTAAGADVLVTWDEGGGTAGPDGSTGGGRIAVMWTGPGVTPGVNNEQFSHYGELAQIEQLEGVPCLANACSTPVAPGP
jgi:phosphatidylinositol-3-phosphatase